MRTTLHVEVAEGVDPFAVNSTDSKRNKFRKFIKALKALIGAGLVASRGSAHPSAWAGTLQASAIVTAATVVAGNTVTLNGTALTATQHNASGTVTVDVSATDNDDTVTIEGVVFTAAAAEDLAAREFDISDTDAAGNASLAACINYEAALATSDLYNLVTATASATAVTIRAVAGGTGGNAITLESDDADGLAVSAATLENGATVASNQFDFLGTDAQTAGALATAVGASATALVSSALIATNRKAVVTLSSAAVGCTVRIGSVIFRGIAGAATAIQVDEFTVGGTDTADATSLKNQINAHPSLKDLVVASSSAGVVTVRPLPDPLRAMTAADVDFKCAVSGSGVTLTSQMGASAECFIVAREKGLSGNQATIASSGGTVAITGGGSRLAGGTRSTYSF